MRLLRKCHRIAAPIMVGVLLFACTKLKSGDADDSSTASAQKKRGLEEPDTIPGYLIDERSFGYSNRDQWLSDIVLTPYTNIRAEGSYVVSLKQAAEHGSADAPGYVVALYGPPPETSCADFIAGLEERGGPSATVDRDFRFSVGYAENMELSSDGLTLTIFAPASAPRLQCTALVVSTSLPEDAGYRPYFGRLAFILASNYVTTGSADDCYVYFSSNERGAIQSEMIPNSLSTIHSYLAFAKIPGEGAFVAGLPQGRVYERHDGAWTRNSSYTRAFPSNLYSGVIGFATPTDDQVLALEGIQTTQSPVMAARTRTGAMGTFSAASFTAPSNPLIGASMNMQGLLGGFERQLMGASNNGLRLYDAASGGGLVASRGAITKDPNGVDCYFHSTSLNSFISDAGDLHFAARCNLHGYQDLPASLNLGRLRPDGTHDWISLIPSGDLGGAISAIRPAMDVDDNGTTHLLYNFDTTEGAIPKLIYISVTAENVVTQEVIELVEPLAEFTILSHSPQGLRIKHEPGGNLHVVVYARDSTLHVPYYGIYVPGSSRLLVKQLSIKTQKPDISPMVLY